MISISCPEWFKDAPCSGMNSTFFSALPSDRSKAVKVCSSCNSRVNCFNFAVENNLTIGVWGGKTGPELDRLVNA